METEILRVRHVEPAEARARGRECKTPRPPKTGSIDNVSSRQGENPFKEKAYPDRRTGLYNVTRRINYMNFMNLSLASSMT